MNSTISFTINVFLAFFVQQTASAATAPCSRFRVHLAAELPEAKATSMADKKLPEDLVKSMELWKNELRLLKKPAEKQAWLACIKQFIFIDTDQDGVRDWTAVVDGRPSRVLFPLDNDIDGDGIANILDANPYTRTLSEKIAAVPPHLKAMGETGRWQELLYSDFGVLAVNHTDEHEAEVLKILHGILKLDSLNVWLQKKPMFHVLYAFASHHPSEEVASYHPTAKAVGVTGAHAFAGGLSDKTQKCKIASALLHELGHALVFGNLTSSELRHGAVSYGGWSLPASSSELWEPMWLAQYKSTHTRLISSYAGTNVHEWFAESFAAHIWEKEGMDAKYCKAFTGPSLSGKLKNWFNRILSRDKKNSAQ